MEDRRLLINRADNTPVPIDYIPFFIGRSLDCDYVIDKMDISNFQCAINKKGDKWGLLNLSQNGTRVNNELLDIHEWENLKSGDIIEIGDGSVQFIFQHPTDVIEINDSITTSLNELEETVLSTAIDNLSLTPVEGNGQPSSSPISLFTNQNDERTLISPVPSEFSYSLNANSNAVGGEELQEPVNVTSLTTRTSSSWETINTNQNQNIDQSQSIEVTETELTCTICFELFIKAVTLNCSHTFCKFCIEQWKKEEMDNDNCLEEKRTECCPLCRTKINSLTPALKWDKLIDEIMETRPSDVKLQRADLIDQRNNIDGATSSASSTDVTNTTTTRPFYLDFYDSDDDDDDDYYYSYYDYEVDYDSCLW